MIALLIAILVSLSPSGGAVPPAAFAAPTGSIAGPMMGGNVSYADASLGRHYLAMRLPHGTRVRVCGPGDCLNLTVNDYGPSVKIRPPRIADLSWWDWLAVCGETNHSAGLCKATALVLESVALPATDTE